MERQQAANRNGEIFTFRPVLLQYWTTPWPSHVAHAPPRFGPGPQVDVSAGQTACLRHKASERDLRVMCMNSQSAPRLGAIRVEVVTLCGESNCHLGLPFAMLSGSISMMTPKELKVARGGVYGTPPHRRRPGYPGSHRRQSRVRRAAGQADRHPLRGHPGVRCRGRSPRRPGDRLRCAARHVGGSRRDPDHRRRGGPPGTGGRRSAGARAAGAGRPRSASAGSSC